MTQLNNLLPLDLPEPEPPPQGPDRFASLVGLYARALAKVSCWTVVISASLAGALVALAGIWWALDRTLRALGVWSS